MTRKEYSASAVKLSFWFMEFKKVVYLLHEGKSICEIQEINRAHNIFGAPTKQRAEQIFNTVSIRVQCLSSSFYSLFSAGDISTQKLIALVAVMETDTLFFDFVYEVIREKMIIGNNEYSNNDLRGFFHSKQLQSEKVAKWTEATIKRLSRCYKTMLFEAGMTDKSKLTRRIVKPILDPQLEHLLKDNDMEPIAKALMGVR